MLHEFVEGREPIPCLGLRPINWVELLQLSPPQNRHWEVRGLGVVWVEVEEVEASRNLELARGRLLLIDELRE